MTSEKELAALTNHFRSLGANDPEGWARSQLSEGINQYARFVFLREAWRNAIKEGEIAWIEREIHYAEKHPHEPGAGVGPALERILACGAGPEDISEVVRAMQWQALAGLIYQIDDSGVVNYPQQDLPRVDWALFEIDANGTPLREIDSLHESLLDAEPSGR